MADPTTGSSGSGKGFSKVVQKTQKTVFRTKEKVLQNLGKADKTKDDEIDQSMELFNEQQNVATKLQKELKRYAVSLKDMCLASQTMYKTIKETYEPNWPGYTDIVSTTEHHSILWDDYVTKLTELQNSAVSYSASFPDIRMKIAKRGRKLTDFDSARHTHDALMNAKKRDEAKIAKALDELNEAKSVYEVINAELHEELPTFYNSRIGVIASIFNQLLTAEVVFQEEAVKLKNEMIRVTQRLINDGSHEFKPKNIDRARSNYSSTATGTTSSSSAECSVKLNNVEGMQRSHLSHMEAESSSKQSVVATSRPYSTQPSMSSVLEKPLNNYHEVSFGSDSRHLPSTAEDSFVTAKSISAVSSPKALIESDDDEEEDDDDDEDDSENIATASAIQTDNAIYSLATGLDDSSEYAVPKYNVPVNRTSQSNRPPIVPSDRILFKVQATHAYVGEDIDELTFEPGEIIIVVPYDDPEEQDDGWLTGVKESTREKGVFPENFTTRI